MFRRLTRVVLIVLVVPLCLSIACAVSLSPRGLSVSATIGGVTTTVTFGPAGIVVTRAYETVKQAAALRMFEQAPTDRPRTAQMTMLNSSVSVQPLSVGKTLSGMQAQPVNGSATVSFSIAPGQSADLCDQATFLSQYELQVTNNEVTVVDPTAELSQDAIDVVLANDITFCIAVTADFDATLVMDDFSLKFGQAEPEPSEPEPGPEPEPEPGPSTTGGEALAGCWLVHYTDAYSSDPAAGFSSEGYVLYEIDSQGRLASFWLYIPPSDYGDGLDAEYDEVFRFTRPNAGIFADAVVGSSQSVSTNILGTEANISFEIEVHGESSGGIFMSAEGFIAYTISGASLSGDQFSGTLNITQTGTVTREGQAPVDTTQTATAHVVGTLTACPDPALEEVRSQEEIAEEMGGSQMQ